MPEPDIASARKAPLAPDCADRAPLQLVCIALMLALAALLCRIASTL